MASDWIRNVSVKTLKLSARAQKPLDDASILTIGELQDRISTDRLRSDAEDGIPGIGEASEAEIVRKLDAFISEVRSPWPFIDRHLLSLAAAMIATFIAV
jgi:hypothetical protein